MGALARLTLLKSAAMEKESSSTYDDELKACLIAASRVADSFCNRSFEAETYEDETYTGNDTSRLFLRNTPVIAVESVKLWDGVDSYDTETAPYYRLIDDMYLQYPDLGQEASASWSCWISDYENGIKVTYTAGYATSNWETAAVADSFGVPSDLEMAVARMAMQLWKDGKKGGIRFGLTSVAQGGDSLAIDRYIQGLPEDVKMTLNQYRRVNI